MIEQAAFQRKLYEKWLEIRSKNPAYSLRAFASKLDLNSGTLSSILNGKRKISKKTALRILDRLNLAPDERAEYLAVFSREDVSQEPKVTYLQISSDQFRVISEWFHFALLSLLLTDDFKPNVAWIARRLGVSVREVRSAIQRLVRLGLLVQNKNGSFSRGSPRYETTDDLANISVRKSHFETLELARKALEQVPIEFRDFTTVTMAVDPSKISEAKKRIRAFQDSLSDLMESGKRTEVYRLSMELFPLTKMKSKGKSV